MKKVETRKVKKREKEREQEEEARKNYKVLI